MGHHAQGGRAVGRGQDCGRAALALWVHRVEWEGDGQGGGVGFAQSGIEKSGFALVSIRGNGTF